MFSIKLRLKKDFDDKEKEKVKNEILKEFGSLDKLRQKVSRTGCRKPRLVDELKILEALEKGSEYKEENILLSARSISALSFKRVNLMEYVSKNKISSIKDLAEGLGRDYKNVYDDVKTLSKHGLMELEKDGKKRIPVLKADKILIEF